MELGVIMVTSRRYMSLTTVPLTMTSLFVERNMELWPRVETTPALSSWMPLMRLVWAAGMCKTFVRRMVHLVCLWRPSSRTEPWPMATAERLWPKPFTVRGAIGSYSSNAERSWKTCRFTPEPWWQALSRGRVGLSMGKVPWATTSQICVFHA